MLLILIHYGETSWVFLTVKIQYWMADWILHIECRGPASDRYICVAHRKEIQFSV
jgi:hypothetical protein